MAAGTSSERDEMGAPATTRARRWRVRTVAALALGAVLAAAMTSLALASRTGGPDQALSAAARSHLIQQAGPGRGARFAAPHAPKTHTLPGTLAGTQLAWLLGEFNGGSSTITEAELRAHFSTTFLEHVPAREMIRFLRRSSNLEGSAVVTGFTGHRAPRSTTAQIAAPGLRRYVVRITLEGGSRHLIASLTIDTARGR
jgi:hypothetical protein